ncbi:MAG: hypothetical protein K8R77_15015 [Anaerolineaceae bacterium]|nr:hypothetical protein [Anaerolineaceae bacterium]
MTIKIVAVSACDLPQEIVQQFDIRVIIEVHINQLTNIVAADTIQRFYWTASNALLEHAAPATGVPISSIGN